MVCNGWKRAEGFDLRRAFALLAVGVAALAAAGLPAAAGDGPEQPAAAGRDGPAPVAGERFRIGEVLFHARWKPAPDISETIDGLGPLFNSDSCAGCHAAGAEVRHVLRFSDRRYGAQLQDRAVAGHAPEGRLEIRETAVTHVAADGRRVPLRALHAHVADPAYGPFDPAAPVSLRRIPPVAGMGFVAAIDEAAIRARADPDDADGDGISGRAGEAVEPATGRRLLARFGWKASVAGLAQQTAEALHLDMGLSTRRIPVPAGDCTAVQAECRAAPHGASGAAAGAEVSDDEVALLVAYLEGLPPPRGTGHSGMAGTGEAVFDRVGCAACHVPEMPLRHEAAPAPLATVRLYSDLLLHDMGPGLADGHSAGAASGEEWRTQPLWGLSARLAEMAAGQTPGLLHDGRARSIEEAILWHGGEAERSRRAYELLAESERSALLDFLSRL